MSTPGMMLSAAHPLRRNRTVRLSSEARIFLLLSLLLCACLPARAASVLANLTVSKPVIFGVGSTTGTVTLNATSTTAVTVTLKSGDANMTVPASVVISAGSLSKTFTIATKIAYAKPTHVTISGAFGGLLQSDVVTGVPAAYSVSIQTLAAGAGNGCVVLTWADLEQGTYRGYNIYRFNGTTSVKLNATPQTSALYPVTGLTNGTPYQYKVSVVSASGTESALSAAVGATPSAAIASLSWVTPPTTATGMLELYAAMSSGSCTGDSLLIDGADAGGGGAAADHPGQEEVSCDTTNLTNGMHTFQLFSFDGVSVFATQPISIQVSNDFNGFTVDGVLLPDQGGATSIQGTMPAGTVQWTLQVLNDVTNAVVRSWTGTTSTIHMSWDGTDSAGVVQASTSYIVQLTAVDNQARQKIAKRHVALIKGTPNGVALIDITSPHFLDDWALKDSITAQFETMHGSNPSFTYAVVYSYGQGKILSTFIAYLRDWMSNTVTDFYLYGHGLNPVPGIHPASIVAGITFWSARFTPGTLYDVYTKKRPNKHFIVPDITNLRQYNFAMIDSCFSLGGNAFSTTLPLDQSWPNAFNIGTDFNYASSFFGWDGLAGENTHKAHTTGTLEPSNWLLWRQQFWLGLSAGYTVYDDIANATSKTKSSPDYHGPEDVNPWDTDKAQFIGDFTDTLP